MSDNFVRFFDSLTLKPLEVPDKVKDYYVNISKETTSSLKPLRVRIAATHAGKVTRNNGFYLPSKMQAGAKTFTDQYPKPIQVHHQSKSDPIGRVVSAKYVDISRGFKAVSKDASSADLVLVDAFVEGRLNDAESVNVACDVFINDNKLLDDPGYEGLGYIEIVADITDPDAIRKIIDGRYLTGSTGASTNRAICSICRQDWAEEGKCEHRPGKKYEGKKCVIIAGNLWYDEYSFVNKPADRHSGIIEININGIQDFVTVDEGQQVSDSLELVLVAGPVDVQQDNSEEDRNMTFKDALELAKKEERFQDKEDLVDRVKGLVDENKDLTDEKLFQLLDEAYKPADDQDAGESAEDNTDEGEDSVRAFLGDEYEDIVGDDEWGREYAEMLVDALQGEDAEEMKDAKLTAASRKKLAGSVFCGPKRSFPVHDCAHAKSAMAYAKKYNKPSSVVSCIRRKAKRLGCPFKDDTNDAGTVVNEFSVSDFDRYEDKQLLQMLDALRDAATERELDVSCGATEDDARKVNDAEQSAEVEKLQVRLDTARKEIKFLHADIDNLTNSMADQVEKNREARVVHIVDLYRLSPEDGDIQQLSDNLKEKTGDEIQEILKDLSSKVDMKEIADTLNSGLSNSPTGEVEDPTRTQDNTGQTVDDEENNGEGQEVQLDDAMKDQIVSTWLRIRMSDGPEKADNWLDEFCKANKIDPSSLSSQEQS